jgi:hypothetical protein
MGVRRPIRIDQGEQAVGACIRAWVGVCSWLVLPVCLLWPWAAEAHLMVAQNGTLNFSGGGAYLVLSVPVSAFERVDDDGDGLLSPRELQAHRPRIEQAVLAAVQLRRSGRALELQGLLLNLSPSDHAGGATHDAPARQLVVMGRFALGEGTPSPTRDA